MIWCSEVGILKNAITTNLTKDAEEQQQIEEALQSPKGNKRSKSTSAINDIGPEDMFERTFPHLLLYPRPKDIVIS